MRDSKQRQDDECGNHVVGGQRVDEVQLHSEEIDLPHVDSTQAVLAAGPTLRLIKQVVDALRQRHRHHGEIDTAGADREPTDQRRHQRGARYADRNRQRTRAGRNA